MTDEKSLTNSPMNLIVGKIHQAYTVAADELFMRGYMTQDERMKVGGLIGDLLGSFRESLIIEIPALASTAVDSEDVERIVELFTMKQISPIQKLIDSIFSPFVNKAGARHSSSDNKAIQSIHDAVVGLGADCGFSIFKAADGKYRWLLTSSSAFEDRDGEIVSTKAQEADVDRMDATKEYGPLRYFHLGAPRMKTVGDWESYEAGDGIDLGICDFSMMQGKSRVESGTFHDEKVAEALAPHADKLGVSIGFSHPPDEPKSNVLYHIKTFERSLIYPRGKESNYLTSVAIMQKESTMDVKQKLESLKGLIGDELFASVTSQVEANEKAAQDAGLKFKEGEQAAEQIPLAAATDAPRKIGEMTEAEFTGFLGKSIGDALAGVSQKEAQTNAKLEEVQVALKAATDGNAHVLTTLKAVTDAQAAQGKVLAALTDDLPKSIAKGFRASQDDSTITKKEVAEKAAPAADDFFAFAMGQPPVPTAG